MVKGGYTTISVPADLADRVDRLVKGTNLGYRSRQEFVTEAIRQQLLSVEAREGVAPPKRPG